MRKPTYNWVTQTAAQHGYPATDYSWHISRFNLIPRTGIYAPEAGTVIGVGLNHPTRGKWIDYKGKSGYIHEFSHCKDVGVQINKSYAEGYMLAVMGQTGLANGVHLHYVVKNSKGVRVPDPDAWINAKIAAQAPKRIAKKGTATVIVPVLNVRNAPSTSAKIQATYRKGEKFNYDSYIDSGGYRWLSYVSLITRSRRYVAQKKIGGSSYVTGGVK